MSQPNRGNGQTTETFRVVGLSSHTEALKRLAKLNPDWNLTPDAIADSGRAGQKIYKLKFINKPVELRPDSDSVTVVISGQEIGSIRPEDCAHVKDILDNYDVQNLVCGIWGGQYKTVDDFYDVTTQQQGIAATVKIVYSSMSLLLDDAESEFAIDYNAPEYPQRKFAKPAKKAKVKKPIFKRWWFWVIVVLVVLIAIGSSGEPAENTVPTATPSEATIETKATESAEISDETKSATVATTEPIASEDDVPTAMKNALKSANSYLNYTAFSYTGLIGQLEYEGYTTEEATYAADNCGADWFEQALRSAKQYLGYSAFSYTGLIGQLEYDGYTTEEATYGADNCGADWFEQAEKSAENYLKYSSFSRDGLISQLEYEGFTNEQAVYGVEQNGL